MWRFALIAPVVTLACGGTAQPPQPPPTGSTATTPERAPPPPNWARITAESNQWWKRVGPGERNHVQLYGLGEAGVTVGVLDEKTGNPIAGAEVVLVVQAPDQPDVFIRRTTNPIGLARFIGVTDPRDLHEGTRLQVQAAVGPDAGWVASDAFRVGADAFVVVEGTPPPKAPPVPERPAWVLEVVRANAKTIDDCLARAVAENPEAAGEVRLAFDVGVSGQATNVQAVKDELGSAAATCLVEAVAGWQFPSPGFAAVHIEFPFALK